MLPQTIKVMKRLREINRSLENALKINEFVDIYLDDCILNGRPVTIITPWSLSPRFKNRFKAQKDNFIPTDKEKSLFSHEIKNIIDLFENNGFALEWWLILSRAYLDSRLLEKKLEIEYSNMLNGLVKKYNTPIAIINWEDDVTMKRHTPNNTLLNDYFFNKTISENNLSYELDRWKNWVNEEGIKITAEELLKQTKYQICCEAEEGKFLMENSSNPICNPGNFLFFVLGNAERYSFFSVISPEFRKRIICVLRQYPWRFKETS
jgi:hypothetical protein